MFASLIKLLPFLSYLLDIFKPGDGEKVTRESKITALLIVLLIVYAAYVSFAYVEQFHAFVEVRERSRYVEEQNKARGELLVEQDKDIRELYRKLFDCARQPPYEGSVETHPMSRVPLPIFSGTDMCPAVGIKPLEPIGLDEIGKRRQELLSKAN